SELEPRTLQGTEIGGRTFNPMFAPDGEALAYYEVGSNSLKRVPITGGVASTIATLAVPCGATWDRDGILVGLLNRGGVQLISLNGGVPKVIAEVGPDEVACSPQMLPGGRAVLFTLAKDIGPGVRREDRWDKAQVVVQSLPHGARKVLVEG